MSRKNVMMLTIVFLCCCTSMAQVGPPKHESRWHHMFSSHRESENLDQRFNDIKCALVLIQSGPRLGTGFYISADGDLVTASHVLGDRAFSKNHDNTINVSFAMPTTLKITNSDGNISEVASNKVENNGDAWLADVAKIKTGSPTQCWLQEVDDKKSRPGEHLITIGYPGLSFQTLTIYTGIMSARLTTNLPTVILVTGEAIPPSNEFIRVQMPISTGLSGAPIIDDENRAVTIVTNAGGWTQDLEHLSMAFRGGAFQQAPPASSDPQPPNTITFSINPVATIAELAGLFHDYASPGYGDAVPLRYLRKPPPQNQPSASHDH